jgi:hypothetical protein
MHHWTGRADIVGSINFAEARTTHQNNLNATDFVTLEKVAFSTVDVVTLPGMAITYRDRKPEYADAGTAWVVVGLSEVVEVSVVWLLEESSLLEELSPESEFELSPLLLSF